MVKLNRNDKCPCGSGKEYKICCLPKGLEESMNTKQKLVSLLRALQSECIQDVTKRTEIRFKLKMIDQFLKGQPRNVNRPTAPERVVISYVLKKINDCFLGQAVVERNDQEQFYLYFEALLDIISNDSNEISPFKSITIYSEMGKYQSSEYTFHRETYDKLDQAEKLKNYVIEIKINERNELYRHFQYYSHFYNGLEIETIKSIATALFLERQIPEASKDFVSYVGLFKYFDGALEQEFRKVIEYKEGWIFKKDYMFKRIIDYLAENELEFIHSNIPNLIEQLNRILEYRNKISHGEWITYEEFKEMKDFCFTQNAFKYLSMLTRELENEQSDNELGIKLNSSLSSKGNIRFDIFKPMTAKKQKLIKLLANFAKRCNVKKPNFRETNRMLRLIEEKICPDQFEDLMINGAEMALVTCVIDQYKAMRENPEDNWDGGLLYLISMTALTLLKEGKTLNEYLVKYLFMIHDANGKFIAGEFVNSCYSIEELSDKFGEHSVRMISVDQSELDEKCHSYYSLHSGLENENIKKLTGLLHFESNINKGDEEFISYNKWYKTLDNILENELFHLISLRHGWTEIKSLSWGQIIKNLQKVGWDSIDVYNGHFVRDLVDLSELRKRNQRGELATYRDFLKLKNFCIEKKGLLAISNLKSDILNNTFTM